MESNETTGDADDRTSDSMDSMAVGSYVLSSVRSRHGDYEVWTALHRPTDMEVVMDVYPKTGDDKALVESIVHKIDLFSYLVDAKVLRLLEVMDTSVAIFLVYEYYSTQSLLQYALNCPLNGSEFPRLVRSLVKTVQGLHRHCFFHGTLGAESFVLTRQKKIRFKDAPSCHAFLRSQAEPAKLDAILSKASDVWSIGALIYRLIAHQLASGLLPAASAGSATDAMAPVVAELDADLSDLLTRMTDQNPTARISTADCMRHPYLTRVSALPPALPAARPLGSGSLRSRINMDIIRFLSRATGAPAVALAEAAAANELSSWAAAYWLMKRRLAAGRGYPTLPGDSLDADDDIDRGQSQLATAAAVEVAESQASREATGQQQQPGSRKSKPASESAGFRRQLAQLRSRRLGLASPRGTDATLTTTATSSVEAAARRRWLAQHPLQQPDRDSLPPITGRSPGNSERTQVSVSEQQLTQDRSQPRKPSQVASRYLAYIRRQEEQRLAAAATAKAAAAAPPTADGESIDTSSAIRVQVQPRRRQRQQHLQHQNPTTTVPTHSPRQPPNSRNDLGRPYTKSTTRLDDTTVDADAAPALADTEVETLYLWDNAIVRWHQWMRSRVAC